MAKFYFSNLAVSDLTEIWEYTIDTWSEKQADKYYQLLISSCTFISQHPGKGKSYDYVAKGLLGYKAGEHIIFYSIVSATEIEVVRILHGMMDLKTKF